MIRPLPWIDLSPYWPELEAIAEGRDGPKRDFDSSEYWTDDSHLKGVCGEKIHSLVTGRPMDDVARINGDGGSDFPNGIDIKTATVWQDPWLKHPVAATKWPRRFVLVALDFDNKRGRSMGWATAEDMKKAPARSWREKGPLQHSLRWTDLRQLGK